MRNVGYESWVVCEKNAINAGYWGKEKVAYDASVDD